MPQLDFATWPGQVVWALVIFAVLYGVMHRVFLPRLRGTLETRSGRIEASLADARRLRDEAEAQAEVARAETAEAQFKAQRTAGDAKTRAAAEAARRNASLEAELNGKLSAAEGRIRAARDQAMGQVGGIAADTAAALTEKLTGRVATGEELARAVT